MQRLPTAPERKVIEHRSRAEVSQLDVKRQVRNDRQTSVAGSSAHDLVRKNKERDIYDREQRAYHQALKADHEPEQQRALVP
jgi:hypothetical protein